MASRVINLDRRFGGCPRTDRTIILDIDSTLLYTFPPEENVLPQLGIFLDHKYIPVRDRIYHLPLENLSQRGDGTRSVLWGITRPYLKEFLSFCFDYFKTVVICTAGLEMYADAVCDELFRDLPKPHAIFSRFDLVLDGKNTYRKPINNFIPRVGRGMSLANTLALDDNQDTFSHNPRNGITIDRYEPFCTFDGLMSEDNALRELQEWLEQPHVIAAADVRELDKANIFPSSLSFAPPTIGAQAVPAMPSLAQLLPVSGTGVTHTGLTAPLFKPNSPPNPVYGGRIDYQSPLNPTFSLRPQPIMPLSQPILAS